MATPFSTTADGMGGLPWGGAPVMPFGPVDNGPALSGANLSGMAGVPVATSNSNDDGFGNYLWQGRLRVNYTLNLALTGRHQKEHVDELRTVKALNPGSILFVRRDRVNFVKGGLGEAATLSALNRYLATGPARVLYGRGIPETMPVERRLFIERGRILSEWAFFGVQQTDTGIHYYQKSRSATVTVHVAHRALLSNVWAAGFQYMHDPITGVDSFMPMTDAADGQPACLRQGDQLYLMLSRYRPDRGDDDEDPFIESGRGLHTMSSVTQPGASGASASPAPRASVRAESPSPSSGLEESAYTRPQSDSGGFSYAAEFVSQPRSGGSTSAEPEKKQREEKVDIPSFELPAAGAAEDGQEWVDGVNGIPKNAYGIGDPKAPLQFIPIVSRDGAIPRGGAPQALAMSFIFVGVVSEKYRMQTSTAHAAAATFPTVSDDGAYRERLNGLPRVEVMIGVR